MLGRWRIEFMKLENLKPGMTVFDCHSHRAGNTVLRTWGVWHVSIIAVDLERGTVMASWNGNEAKRFYRGEFERWKLREPLLIKTGFGLYRKANRAEIQASKTK